MDTKGPQRPIVMDLRPLEVIGGCFEGHLEAALPYVSYI